MALDDALRNNRVRQVAAETYEVHEPIHVMITQHMIGLAGMHSAGARLSAGQGRSRARRYSAEAVSNG